jgi:hypothetical protein
MSGAGVALKRSIRTRRPIFVALDDYEREEYRREHTGRHSEGRWHARSMTNRCVEGGNKTGGWSGANVVL